MLLALSLTADVSFGQDASEAAFFEDSSVESDLLSAAGITALALTSPFAPNPIGEQNVLVILVNFRDKPSDQPYTSEHARSLILEKLAAHYQEMSYGLAYFNGDVTGWHTVDIDSSSCSRNELRDAAENAAILDGFDTTLYNHWFIGMASGSCGNYGTWGSKRGYTYVAENYMAGSSVLVPAHELGHAFGLHHSKFLNCRPEVLRADCSFAAYGDGFDYMGGQNLSPAGGHFNLFQKERLRWVGAEGSPPLTEVVASGSYSIAPIESPGKRICGAKDFKGNRPCKRRNAVLLY